MSRADADLAIRREFRGRSNKGLRQKLREALDAETPARALASIGHTVALSSVGQAKLVIVIVAYEREVSP